MVTQERARTVPAKCLSCHAKLKSPVVCERCYSLYPVPEKTDYFDLFQLPRGYDVDADVLEERFLALSRHTHPDFFTTQPPEVRHLSLQLSARINEAYRVLKDPVLRAEYLLESSGGESAVEDKSVPGDFLAEVMQLREDVEEALASGDPARLAERRADLERRREQAREAIAEAARKLPQAKYAEMLQLRRQLNVIKYLDNIYKLL